MKKESGNLNTLMTRVSTSVLPTLYHISIAKYGQSFDTANTYSNGESEVILGKFLKAHDIPRESVVILTKTFNPDAKAEDLGPAGLVNHRGSSRKVSSHFCDWRFD